MNLKNIVDPFIKNKLSKEFTNQFLSLNESALNIFNLDPDNYHRRRDYQGIVDLRSRIIAEKEKNDSEKLN